jgi:shikimate kinase
MSAERSERGRTAENDTVENYYEHHALVALERHVALYGLITQETRAVAHRAAVRSGLNLLDVRRLAEHYSGLRIDEIVLEDGEEQLQRTEHEALLRALADRPYGLVAVPDSAALLPGAVERLRTNTTLVILDLDLPNLFWRLRGRDGEGSPEDPMAIYDPLAGPFERIEELRPFYQARERLLGFAQHRLPARGRSVEQLARDLCALLKELDTRRV